MFMKSVTLPSDIWEKIQRRLTAEVGADDESRRWAAMIGEQASGSVKVTASRSGVVKLKAGRGVDLRGAKILD